MEFIAKYWAPIWAVITTIGLVIMALLSKTYAKRDSVVALRQDLTTLETKFNDLPTKTELHSLQLEIANLRGDLKELSPRLDRVQHMSDLLLENELRENQQ